MQVKFTAPDFLATNGIQTRKPALTNTGSTEISFDSVLSKLAEAIGKEGRGGAKLLPDSERKAEQEPPPEEVERVEPDAFPDDALSLSEPEEAGQELPEFDLGHAGAGVSTPSHPQSFTRVPSIDEVPRPTDQARSVSVPAEQFQRAESAADTYRTGRSGVAPVLLAQMAGPQPLASSDVTPRTPMTQQSVPPGGADIHILPASEANRQTAFERDTPPSPEAPRRTGLETGLGTAPLTGWAQENKEPVLTRTPEPTMAKGLQVQDAALPARGSEKPASRPLAPEAGRGAPPVPSDVAAPQPSPPITPTGQASPALPVSAPPPTPTPPTASVRTPDAIPPEASPRETNAPSPQTRIAAPPQPVPEAPQPALPAGTPSSYTDDTDLGEPFDLAEIAPFSDKSTSVATTASRYVPQVPAAARQVLQHMIETPIQVGERIEITLSPEELGRVRLSAAQTDQGVILMVQAERPETLDLMRRHLPELMQDLRDLGFGDVSYSGQNQSGSRPQPERNTAATTDSLSEYAPQSLSDSGLDLRL